MNIPFIRFFKKEKPEESSVALASRPIVAVEKPASERLGKTVLPNSSRIVGLESSANLPIPAPATPTQTVLTPSRKISLGGSGSIAVEPKSSPSGSPAERTIGLLLADLVANIPTDVLKPAQVDPDHRVLLKASEVERGMATGRPTVLLRAIYKQAPELFTSEVPATDLREVALPFAKVVEQFATFQVRDDQITDREYPQVETPFLQVTMEDNARFGSPVAPAAAPKIPALQPAPIAEAKPAIAAPAKPAVTAESKSLAVAEAKPAVVAEAKPPVVAQAKPAAAPGTEPTAAADSKPAAAAAPKAIPPVKFSAPPPPPVPAPAPANVATPLPPPTPVIKAPLPLDQPPPSAPTAANISPNGTGGPAAERVPASSGPPVPTPLPSPLAPLPPTRIPFKITPPSNDLRAESKFPSPRANQEAGEFAGAGPCIALSLRNILRNVAPFQLTAPIDSVPENAQIEIPFSIVQPQLSLGRVALSPAQFQAALPEEHRALFKADPAGTPIPLALQDILQNLPSETLRLRGDQEEPEVADAFETPFSQKANEDAARLKVAAGPISRTTAGPSAPAPEAAAPVAAVAPPPAPATPKLAVGETPAAAQPAVAPKAPAPKPASAPAQPVAKAVVTSPKGDPAEPARVVPVVPKEAPAESPKVTVVLPKGTPAESAKVAPVGPPKEAPAESAKVAVVTPSKGTPAESAKVAPFEPPKETPELASAPKAEAAPTRKTAPAATATGIRTSLQNLLDTDEPLDAKSVVGHISRLAGVSACAIVFSDGLSLAGNIPAEYEGDALCALAPSILKRMSEQMVGAKFGALQSLTLCCGKTPLSLFAHGNICLAAIHSRGEITPEVRDRLGRTTQELARMYAEAA